VFLGTKSKELMRPNSLPSNKRNKLALLEFDSVPMMLKVFHTKLAIFALAIRDDVIEFVVFLIIFLHLYSR